MNADLERISRILERSSDPDNPGPEKIREILRAVDRIAVVGMSRDPSKAARRVPSYLAANGYELIPVNPHADRLLGKPALASLDEVEEAVDLVLVFRPSKEAGEHVGAAAGRDEEPIVWLQEGIRNDEAANEARGRGLTVVQDLCMYKIHRALGEPPGR